MEYGTKIDLVGNFSEADINRNRGGFNYRRYLNSQNIYGSIYMTSLNIIDLPKGELIYRLKNSIEKSFLQFLPKKQVGILEGMIIGDTSYLSDEIEEDFRKSGISHLLAVSGANVAYVLILCKFLFEKLFGRNVSHVLTIIFIILFMILSGSCASVVRATIMAIILILAELFSQKANTYASISFSAMLILIYNPFIVYDVGFILSFGGTLGIVLFSDKLSKWMQKKFLNINSEVIKKLILIIIDTLSVTLSAQIIVTPITLYYFNTFSFVSVIVNLIVVPITGMVTIMGIALYVLKFICFPIAKLLSYILYSLITFMIETARIFSNIPFSTILLPTPTILEILLYYCIVAFWKKKNIRNCCIVMISILIIIRFLPTSSIKINVVDVGQGDCIFIETTKRRTILVDSGGSENSNYDVGENILVPYLLDRGKIVVDYAFLSHMHEDHVEGIFTVLEKMKVRKIFIGKQNEEIEIYQKLINLAKANGTSIYFVQSGDKIKVDGIVFEILFAEEDKANLNNTSLVIKMSYGNSSILLTGDAEKELEEKLSSKISANILKVGHHGSKTSSSDEFIQKVSPQIALIGVGKDNHFGHPNEDVIKRLKDKNVLIYRTDLNGEIYIEMNKKGKIKIKTFLK